jgi:hypothetical protein
LRCIAEGNQAPSVLDQHRPSDSALNCGGVRSPWPQDD